MQFVYFFALEYSSIYKRIKVLVNIYILNMNKKQWTSFISSALLLFFI